jgi:hypothetical protein
MIERPARVGAVMGSLVVENGFPVEAVKYAEQHLATIPRSGRFPGRNDALGRQSTRKELDFLKDHGIDSSRRIGKLIDISLVSGHHHRHERIAA